MKETDFTTFDGQTVVITGAGHGLGREFALSFAEWGANVVVNDIGTHPELGRSTAELVVEEIIATGGRAVANTDSIAHPESAASIAETALSAFGSFDVLVNNAAIVRQAAFEDLDLDHLDAMLNVNLRGTILVTQAAYEHMSLSGYGRIVTLSSGASMFGMRGQVAYAAAKSGLVGMTKVIALEGAARGVLANVVLPSAATNRSRTKIHWTAEDRETLVPRMRTELVTPIVGYLSSRGCNSTGGLFSAVAGRYARAFIGVSAGWLPPGDEVATPNDIAAHLEQIDDLSDYSIPASLEDEFSVIASRLRGED